MTAADSMRIALTASVFLLVFAAGLRAEPRNATYLLRSPGELGRMILAMFVVMPLFALSMARTFELNPAVKIALVAFALSPVPPLLPKQAVKVSSATDYTIGLLVAASVLSIVTIPLAMLLLDRALGTTFTMSSAVIAKQMLVGVLLPLATGMIVRRFAPAGAERLAKPASTTAFIVLVACVAIILVEGRHALVSLFGNGTVLSIVVFVVVGLATGHLLGGPDPERRSVLAIATSWRHPGIAVAIAHANFPEQKHATAAVLLCLLVGLAVGAPYKKWMISKRGTPAVRERRV